MELNITRDAIDLLLRANDLKDEKATRYDKGKFTKNMLLALKLYDRLLSEIGETPGLLAAKANCQFRLASLEPKFERFQEAIALMKRAIALVPNDADLHVGLAGYYELATNEYKDAADECRKAIELSPYDVEALRQAAFLYRYPERVVSLEESVSWLERLIVLEPNNAGYHAFLAEQYQSIGRFQDANREAIRALLCPRPLESGWIDTMKHILDFEGKQDI